MQVNTSRFGELEVSENNIISFEKGLPGFEDLKKYVIVDDSEDDNSFKWLQSVEDTETALPIINPFEIKKEYEFEIDNSTKESLELKDLNEVAVYSVAVVPDRVTQMTVNLKAPIVINTTNNKAHQMIVNDEQYDTQHHILDETLSSVFCSMITQDNAQQE